MQAVGFTLLLVIQSECLWHYQELKMEYLQLVFWMFLYIGFGLVIGHSMGYREGHKDGYQRGKAVGRHISQIER